MEKHATKKSKKSNGDYDINGIGSLGIGLSVAKLIAKFGGRVIIAARNKKELISALNEINIIANNNHH